MRRFVLFVVGFAFIAKTAGGAHALLLPPGDSCQRFGRNFCTGASCEVWRKEDAFTCRCDSEDTYFGAVTQMCHFKKSCNTTECAIGRCKEASPKNPKCVCEGDYDLTLFCKATVYFTKDCAKKGGTALVVKDWTTRAKCDCGEWAVMKPTKDRLQDKCVPTTCLHPATTCKNLCEKKLLEKDPRCCEGWDQSDCSKAPKEGTYCSPGSIRKDGECKDACTAGEGDLLCREGCTKSKDPKRAYECRCGQGQKVAEDGLTCRFPPGVRRCSAEEKKQCRADQECAVTTKTREDIVCMCAAGEHEVDGVCTGDCKDNNCHEAFTDCVVRDNQQSCSCPWKSRKPRPVSGDCVLDEYYYTVTFKPNMSLETEDCMRHERRVLDALRTALGPQIYNAEVLNCKGNITARLMTEKPLSKYLLKMLQTCEYSDGDVCIFYPLLPIKKGSATEIKEENLCETLLKAQEAAYKGANKCVKEGDLFWFKCESGYREVDRKTIGRLRRSVCEPGVSCAPEEQLRCHKDRRICLYENGKPECKCPRGTIEDHKECIGRTKCNPTELQECRDKGRECAYKEHTAQCVCPKGMAEVGGDCTAAVTCTHEKKLECGMKGEECIVENDEGVCKKKGDSSAETKPPPGAESITTTEASSAAATCTEEKKQECDRKGEECIIETGGAVCRKKGDSTAATTASPGAESITTTEVSSDTQGSGSDTTCVSAVLLLGILIAVLPA